MNPLKRLRFCWFLLLAGTDLSRVFAQGDLLVTQDMQQQFSPELQAEFDSVRNLLLASALTEAQGALDALQKLSAAGQLNYWETFEFYILLGDLHVARKDYRAARDAFEECLKFSDIDTARRLRALCRIADQYVRLKQPDEALATYHELNGLRGGKDSELLTHIATVYTWILDDWESTVPYLEGALINDPDPKRSRYEKLRSAYTITGNNAAALQVTKAMIDRFDEPDDEREMERIIKRMNRQLE